MTSTLFKGRIIVTLIRENDTHEMVISMLVTESKEYKLCKDLTTLFTDDYFLKYNGKVVIIKGTIEKDDVLVSKEVTLL